MSNTHRMISKYLNAMKISIWYFNFYVGFNINLWIQLTTVSNVRIHANLLTLIDFRSQSVWLVRNELVILAILGVNSFLSTAL